MSPRTKARTRAQPQHAGEVLAGPVDPPRSGLPRQRRPKRALLLFTLAALAGLSTMWLFMRAGDRVEVLAVTHTIQAGEVLEVDDLTIARIPIDPALAPIPASEQDTIVGSTAATRLSAGSLLTREAITAQPVPGPGKRLVAIAVKPGQAPARPLQSGDRVVIVDTPAADGVAPTAAPRSAAGVVAGSHFDDVAGVTVVDVEVPADQAGMLAARAATGRVAIVLEPAGKR